MCPKSYPNPKYYNCIEKNGDAKRVYKGGSSNSRFLFLMSQFLIFIHFIAREYKNKMPSAIFLEILQITYHSYYHNFKILLNYSV